MSWITENITAFVTDVIGGVIELFGEFFNNIFFLIVEIATANVYIINAEKFIILTAIALISVVAIKVVISGYLLETDYDSEADPFNLIVKIVEAVAVITNSGWIFNWMLDTARVFTSDLLGSADASGFSEQTSSLLQINMGFEANAAVAFDFMLFVLLGAVIVFTVVAGLRGAELVAMKLFMPYFALDLLTNSRERWNNFLTAYVMAFFTYAFQILFFIVALKCYQTASSNPQYVIPTLIWIIMAIRAPRFLEKFLYKSGLSNAASSGLRMIAQTMVMRKAFV